MKMRVVNMNETDGGRVKKTAVSSKNAGLLYSTSKPYFYTRLTEIFIN